ncbi:MAG: serine/threonine-protein kinase [Myxococcota bacterium]
MNASTDFNDTARLFDQTPYDLVRPLGSGGTADVFEGRHRALHHPVAIKLMRLVSGVSDLAGRMKLEARVQANLHHPNIVPVTDFGQAGDGRPYFVMPYFTGRSLRAEIAEVGVFSLRHARRIIVPVLEGLSAAHEIGLVHRDIKPGNIFLADSPRMGPPVVKILDFGLAKVVSAVSPVQVPSQIHTATGRAVGTIKFLPPEQAQGLSVDGRTDLYSVGMTLYYMLAGRGPYDHALTAVDRMVAHVTESAAPPSLYRPQPLPREWDALVLRALARNPDDRFQNALEFIAALKRAPTQVQAPSPPRPRPPHGQVSTQIMPATPDNAVSPRRVGHYGTELLDPNAFPPDDENNR